ncbi:MAG: DNA mismatch repair protein MutS [Syntrophomonadaceae bacterium]|nr:DNA mismatch repair protein MutS [Syntrophomonadaceae bacterium]
MVQYTPMLQQYLQIKNDYPDTILFFRLGDFYEMFFEDARIGSRELEIVLTARDGGEEKVPMCGIPYHALDNYLAKLVSRGFKVAICEQVEDPREAKGVVRREVTRVVTPGTVLEAGLLEDNRNNYLAAVIEENEIIGLAWADISTGEFRVSELEGPAAVSRLKSQLQRLSPAECLIREWNGLIADTAIDNWPERLKLSIINDSALNVDRARQILLKHFRAASLEGFGLKDYTSGTIAAAAIVLFIDETCKTNLKHLTSLGVYLDRDYMEIDYSSRRNLELNASLREGKREGSLLGILDNCATAMGKRTIRKWMEQPLLDIDKITSRQDAIAELLENMSLRGQIKIGLSAIYDLERIAARIGADLASPRDLLALRDSIAAVHDLANIIVDCHSSLLKEIAGLDRLDDIYVLLERSIKEEAPLTVREGNIIKTGYHPEIDELRSLSHEGSQWLIDFENREKQRTGIKYLKVGFNKVYGYYIEISKSSLSQVPPDYYRKQTLVNNERFICEELKTYEEKILGAREKLYNLEYDEFIIIRDSLVGHLGRILETASHVAALDVLHNLAEKAYLNDYRRPVVDLSTDIAIHNGRHPVVEHTLRDGRFVPNDLHLHNDQCFAIITGPNMGGKSTFMRQTALIIIMAQMGSYIPAESARIGLVEQVFTRVGAADDLAAGQSTFMVEMVEVANILNNARKNSLIILDEIGRGTSTYDGLSIAQAVAEYIHRNIGARTLFATHYHEITALADHLPGIFNLAVSVLEKNDTVVFLKKVLPGKADKSYGLHVASLAGVPEAVVTRGQELLENLETAPAKPRKRVVQPGLFTQEDSVTQELRDLNPDNLSPREALDLIYRWKELQK